MLCMFFFKQRTAYEMRIIYCSSDVCASDLPDGRHWKVAALGRCGLSKQGKLMPEGRNRPGSLQADQVQPFLIESSGIRGRLLRLEGVCDHLLARHDYPAPVARLLAEMLALCGGLASLTKYDGLFTLQASGHGPLPTMVVPVTSAGESRGKTREP